MLKLALTLLVFCTSCFGGLPLYYWRAKTYINFGDHLSLKLVERIVGKEVTAVTLKSEIDQQKLLAIGSIITMARSGDVVWGSGIKSEGFKSERYKFTSLDIRSVRGPRTRSFLMNELGVNCPEIYGDPALLLPYFFPEFKKSDEPSYEYVIIPHYSEMDLFEGYDNVICSTDPWDTVIEKILNSKFVIASSLHGIIVAEAFGIPARLLRVTDNQPFFKYQDYYEGTGRPDFTYAETVAEALLMGGERPFICDLKKLYEAFPFDYFPEASPIALL